MSSTPKIRGYIAENREVIVLLYRKSHKVTYLVTLNYKNRKEILKIGSRFYGRFYPNRCDISSDGRYFLYFAMGKSQKKYDKKLYCWTAICMPPKLTANILFEHNDTWGGGGRFIDNKHLFIAPGMYPSFDTTKKRSFDKYEIIFDAKLEDFGWNSGKGWKLVEQQIDPHYGEKYPIPKTWKKTTKGLSIIKTLEYDSHPKLKNGNEKGAYDIHSYDLFNEKTNEKYSLNDNETCQWADFDNYGRIILSRGNNLFIYQNSKSIKENEPQKKYDLEELITLPNTVYK